MTVARVNQDSIRVNVIPSRKKDDENPALATPLSFSGSPEELDRELGKSVASYVEANLQLQSTLAEAKTEMEAAAKAARDQARARAKTSDTVKKQEDTAAKDTKPENTTPADQNMTLFAPQPQS